MVKMVVSLYSTNQHFITCIGCVGWASLHALSPMIKIQGEYCAAEHMFMFSSIVPMHLVHGRRGIGQVLFEWLLCVSMSP